MTAHTSPATVLRCTSPAEFLASVPLLLGYTPAQSVVVTMFEGSRAQSAARFDLPRADTPFESTGLDEAVCELVASLRYPESIAIVIYSDATFTGTPGAPHALLAMWLERAVEMRGIAVRELACVARDGWSLYRAPSENGPRALSEITALHTAWSKHLPPQGKLPTLEHLGSLPDPDPDLAGSIARAIDSEDVRDIFHHTVETFNRLITRCSLVLTEGLSVATSAETATLVLLTQQIQTWLIPVMLISADTEEELSALSDETAEAFLALLQHPGLTPPAGGSTIAQRLLMFSSERLTQSRLRTIIHTLTQVASHTPAKLRPPMLALAAWCWWMGGMSTPATMLLTEAQTIDSSHPAVLTVGELLEHGAPLWIFARE